MQAVSDRWYIIFSYVATILALVILGACVVVWLSPNLQVWQAPFGLTYITFAITLLQVLYTLFLYKREANHSGHWSASLFIMLFQALTALNLIHTTGQLESYYMIYWMVLVLFSGMFGLYAVIGSAFIMSLYFVLAIADTVLERSFEPTSTLILFAAYLAGLVGYLFWRGRYIDQEAWQISQLSGQLKSKQLQSEILIQSIADGVIVANREGKISLMNPAAANMTEWQTDEAIGLDVTIVLSFNKENGQAFDEKDDPFVSVLRTKQSKNQVVELIGRDGKKQIVSLVISPVLVPRTEDMVGTVAVMRDISEARAEEQRRADFISTASHEMRTPVAAVEGYLALALNENVSRIDQKAREYLEKAHASTQHLGKLFQDLLTSAKAEDGRLVSHPVVVEMGSFLEQLTDTLKFAAEKKGLFVEFVFGTSTHTDTTVRQFVKPLYYAHIDPDRMREALTNLFDNAVKYTPEGKITVGVTANDEVVQVYVRDTGIGIPKEDVPHMFQKFYRVDNTDTRTIGGTGLGLFIARKIVELYKGKIWVESQFRKGSTFYINLPRLSTTKATEMKKKETPQIGRHIQ